jgi:hypothetical protein
MQDEPVFLVGEMAGESFPGRAIYPSMLVREYGVPITGWFGVVRLAGMIYIR